jgi:hypothetical protein
MVSTLCTVGLPRQSYEYFQDRNNFKHTTVKAYEIEAIILRNDRSSTIDIFDPDGSRIGMPDWPKSV